MKKLATSIFLALMLLCAQAQYTTVYENSFRDWAPGQGWVMINNDTIPQQAGLVTRAVLDGVFNPVTEVLNNMLGLVDTGYWSGPLDVAGACDKIMISPPLALGADPYAIFHSCFKAGGTMDAYVISNPNDTTLDALSNNVLSCLTYGFNVINLNNWSNTTVRIAFRIRGQNTYGYIDDIKVLNKTSFATIPDSSFRLYLRNLVPTAFVGYQFNYLDPLVLNTRRLDCKGCGIQSLEGLQYFPFVNSIDFSNNKATYVPPVPFYYLDTIRLTNNLLPFAPPTPLARYLYLENNLIERIPAFYPRDITALQAQNNSILDCLRPCNRFVEGNLTGNVGVSFSGTYYSMQRDTPYYGIPAECRYDFGTISGIVYLDENMDGDYDLGETLLPNQRILFSQGSYVFTHQRGNYGANIDSGYVNMDVLDLPPYFTCTNPLATHIEKNEVITHNFRIVATSAVNDLGINVVSLRRVRPGAFLSVILTAKNYGTTLNSGVVKMHIPAGYTLQNITAGTIVNDTLIWPVNLQPFHTQTSRLLVIASYSSGDTLRFNTTINAAADGLPANNRDSCMVIIDNMVVPERPLDPNNKLVDKPEVTPGFNDYLTYSINFENIGTGSATRVKVRDYLPHTLDFSTFEMLGASHPYTIHWMADSIVEFIFYPIALTPKSIDSVHSHGHIWYRIKPLQPMPAGSYISNSAGIYFDTEPVVNTEACLVRAGQLHAAFITTDTVQCGTEKIVFRDQSPGTLYSRQWYFEGGTPLTATAKQVQVSYPATGSYKVTLVVTSRDYTDSIIQWVNVVVAAPPVTTITALGPAAVCLGDSVTLTAPAGPLYTYKWSTGQTGSQIVLKVSTGLFLTVTDALGCTAYGYKQVVVSNPTPKITNTAACENPVGVLKLNTNFANRLWSTGDTTATITVNQYGVYRVTVSDVAGCERTDSFNFVFRAKPRPEIVGDSINCEYTSITLSLNQPYTAYKWSNNATTPTVQAGGYGNVMVTVTDVNGCTGADTFLHRVFNSGYVSFKQGPGGCKGQGYRVEITGNSHRSYLWSTGDTAQIVYLQNAGRHDVTITFNNGCEAAYGIFSQVDSKFNLRATGFDTAYICPGQNLDIAAVYNRGLLTAAPAGCSGGTTVVLGTGMQLETGSSTREPGLFNNMKKAVRSQIILRASELKSLLGGAKLITELGFNIGTLNSNASLENFSIKMSPTSKTEAGIYLNNYVLQEVYRTNTFVPVAGWNSFTLSTPVYWDGVSNLMIDISNFNPSGQGNLVNKAICTATSYYSYSTIWDSLDLSNRLGIGGWVFMFRPNIRFNYCMPAGAVQPVSVPQFQWSWHGGAATVANPTAPYTTAIIDSLVTFVVTVSDTFGCTETDSVTLPGRRVNQLSIDAGAGELCTGGILQLCATSGINNYLWNGGSTSACYTATTPGTYNVTATDDRGCVGSDTVTITNGTLRGKYLTASKTALCPGEIADICVTGGTDGYHWNTNESTDCIRVGSVGVYTLDISNGCIISDTITVQMLTVQPLNITATKAQLCPNDSAIICINNVGGTYSWNNGGTTACITAGNAGVYKVAVVDANQCLATDSITIQTLTVQPLSITATKTQLCPNDSAQICINNVGGTYSWNNGGTTTCITAGNAGVYKVAVVDANQCLASDSITIQTLTVQPLNITATKTQLCPNDSAQICISNVGGTYSWNNGGTAACITAGTAGVYKVAVVDANQCTTLDSIEIQQAIITPVVITSLKTSLCGGDSITVCTAISSAGYLWNTQATDRCISVTDSGSYWVTATDLNTCTVESNRLTITKVPLPVINANSNILSTTASGSYQWYLNDTAITGANTAAFTAVTSGNYKVLVTDTGGCQNYSNTLNVLYNGIANTGTIKALQVKLYPNPFSAAFTIEIGNRNFRQVEFMLTNSIGQEILRDANTCFADRFTKTFNLSALAAGVYFVSTTVDGEKVVHRIVKE